MKHIYDLNGYQLLANQFINRPAYANEEEYLINSALGMCGESGEFADLIKKVKYHGHHGNEFTQEVREKLIKEAGDVLWYIAQACIPLRTSLSEIASINIQKLSDRHGDKFSERRSESKDESKEANNIVVDLTGEYIDLFEKNLAEGNILDHVFWRLAAQGGPIPDGVNIHDPRIVDILQRLDVLYADRSK